MTSSNSNMDSQGGHIDTLLERYLSLLDEYTTLRETLNSLQRDIYQGLARANFSAERGIRYGADHYDERMQATRRVEITFSSSCEGDGDGNGYRNENYHGSGISIIVKGVSPPPAAVVRETEEEQEAKRDKDGEVDDEPAGDKAACEEDAQDSGNAEELPGKEEKEKKKQKIKSNDPLRWFGLLTPLPLRQAQTNAIKAVEEIIPRLASVNMAMAEVELEVRRARKKRAKAAAAAEKAERAGKAEAEAGEEVQAAA